ATLPAAQITAKSNNNPRPSSEGAGCRALSGFLQRQTKNAEIGTTTNPYEYVLLLYQILTMEPAVERSTKVVISPANASAVSDWIHKPAAWRCSSRVGSAVQTDAEEVEIGNYDPLG